VAVDTNLVVLGNGSLGAPPAQKMSARRDDYTEHLLKVLKGHRRRSTRFIHLIAVYWSLPAFLCMIAATINVPIHLVAGVNCLINYRNAGAQRLGLVLATSTLVYAAMFVLDSYAAQITASSPTAISFYLLVFVTMGLMESGAHHLFDDHNAGQVTAGKRGLEKVLGIIVDVILKGPISFLHLALVDFPSTGSGLFPVQSFLATTLVGNGCEVESLQSMQAQLAVEDIDIASSQRKNRGGTPAAGPPFVWKQVPPKDAVGTDNGEHDNEMQAKFETTTLPDRVMAERADSFFELMSMRRSLRFYSPRDIPPGVLEKVIQTAGTAPSGAHKQPWTFVVVRSPGIKKQIRSLVEAEEKINYDRRMKKSWVRDLDSLTGKYSDPRLRSNAGCPLKPYLTEAPALVVAMRQIYGLDEDGNRFEHYYVSVRKLKQLNVINCRDVLNQQHVCSGIGVVRNCGWDSNIRPAKCRSRNVNKVILACACFAARDCSSRHYACCMAKHTNGRRGQNSETAGQTCE